MADPITPDEPRLRMRWIYLFLFALDWACLTAFMWPMIQVSAVITAEEAWNFVYAVTPVIMAAALFQTLPWYKGRRW